MIGTDPGGPNMPCPNPIPSWNVSRSRSVIGRSAGTVSSSGPSTWVSTRREASSGRNSSTGSSSRSAHSSTRMSAATAATGFDIEAMRKIVSGSAPPAVSRCVSPSRDSSATASPASPRSTDPASRSATRRSRDFENPPIDAPTSRCREPRQVRPYNRGAIIVRRRPGRPGYCSSTTTMSDSASAERSSPIVQASSGTSTPAAPVPAPAASERANSTVPAAADR